MIIFSFFLILNVVNFLQICEIMKTVTSAAERQRLYRQRRDADPTRRQAYLAKEKESWERKKKAGKARLIQDLRAREQRSRRKMRRQL
jgi:hypothetical protein